MALATRRVNVYDGDEHVGVDYVADDVLRVGPRTLPFDTTTPARRKRYNKLRAIAELKRLGWIDRDIADAIDYTERHVTRRKGLLRALAEASGRV